MPIDNSQDVVHGVSRVTSNSFAYAPHGIAAVFDALEIVVRNEGYQLDLTGESSWNFPSSHESTGKRFAEKLPQLVVDVRDPVLMSNILKTCVQLDNVDAVNKFLSTNGYTSQLKPMPPIQGKRIVSAASILDILVEWKYAGVEDSLTLKGSTTKVPAAKVTNGVSFYSSTNLSGGQLIVELTTKGTDKVYLANSSQRIQDGDDLGEFVATLSRSKSRAGGEYSGVRFPMVDFSYKGDIDWLIDAEAKAGTGDSLVIKQAMIEQRLRMNHKGARAQQAVAVGGYLSRSMPQAPKIYDLNGEQLLVWFERPNKSEKPVIVYSALVTPDHMKKPAGLGSETAEFDPHRFFVPPVYTGKRI